MFSGVKVRCAETEYKIRTGREKKVVRIFRELKVRLVFELNRGKYLQNHDFFL